MSPVFSCTRLALAWRGRTGRGLLAYTPTTLHRKSEPRESAQEARARKSRDRVLPGTTYRASAGASSSSSSSSWAAPRQPSHKVVFGAKKPYDVALPKLRCPGGPRMKAEGIKHLYKVPHAGILAKEDLRFVLNLKLTHQLASYLSRTTLKSSDKVIVELGPGAGAMTRSLLTRPCVGVLGIEVDERFNPYLEQIRVETGGKFQWMNSDVLQLNELQALATHFPAFVMQNVRRRPDSEGEGASRDADATDEDNSTAQRPDASTKRQEPSWTATRRSNTVGGGEDDAGVEGSPLRSRERQRMLEKRLSRHGRTHGASFSSSSFGGRGETPEAPFSTSPNPAFDVTHHWWADGDAKVEVVANLPFNLISELLLRYCVDCSRRHGLFSFGRVPLHIFTQKEVADRIAAGAGSLAFSRLSVMAQCYFHVRVKQTFSEWTYYPRTEVLGALLTLEPRAVPLVGSAHGGLDGAALLHFLDHLMKPGLRGATIYKALMSFAPPEVVQYILQELRMDGAITVLDLSVEEICRAALLWKQFLSASQQQQQQQQSQV